MKPEEIKKISTVRKIKSSEIPFVCNSWIKSYANNPLNFLKGDDYPAEKHKEITAIIDHSDILIITPSNLPELIIGYIVYKDNILEFLYVKFAYRKQGFAKRLWEEAGGPRECTHWNPKADIFAGKYQLINCLGSTNNG
jgi:hypothetical protein